MNYHKPITLLHISDLHYKSTRAYDQSVVLTALLNDVDKQSETIGQPDIILFSGDLVHSADDKHIYELLYDSFLEPLLETTNCDLTRLFLCPGNHDLHRSFFSTHLALQEDVETKSHSRDSINEVYLSGEAAQLARLKSREFFEFVEFFEPEGEIYRDEIISVYSIAELSLSIINLNTAWLGRAGVDDVSDLQKLAVPEAAIAKAVDSITNDDYIIANFHHPLNWHFEHASQDFQDLLFKKANMCLFGHVHDPRPVISSNSPGGLITNQSGALYTWRSDRYLGYSFIRVEPNAKHAELTWRSYFDKRRAFDVATNIDDNHGRHYSSESARSYFSQLVDGARTSVISKWVIDDVLPPLVEASADGILDKPTSEVFVSPPLYRILPTKTNDPELEGTTIEDGLEIDELIDDSRNYVIESYPEHGKTSLLMELCRRVATKSQTASTAKQVIPIYLPFSVFVPGTNRVEKAIRDRLPGTPSGCNLSMLLNQGCFTVCIDDVVYNDNKRFKELRDFISKYKGNRFLITTTIFREYNSVASMPSFGAHFEKIQLRQFRRADLRKLARKIDDTSASEEALLERVIRELRAINVPATPLNSSLLMDIISRDSTFSPLNRPALIERFIETLLRKRSLGEVERKKFDFRNQVHYLGYIAEHMCRENKYIMSFDELSQLTISYLSSLGLNFSAHDIINNALASKIFTSRHIDDSVCFRFRAFLEYFVASKMRDDENFKSWILDEDRYLSYLNEIEYYSGLERSDLCLLRNVSERHLNHHDAVFGNDFEKVLTDEQLIRLPTSLEGSKKFADELAEQLKEAPLTEIERDELLEGEVPRDAEGRQEVFRPIPKDIPSKYILSLFMYTALVKNTELVEDSEKRFHLSCVLKSWSSTILTSFLSIPSLVKNRKMTINGLTYIVSFPRSFSDEEVARRIALNLPKEISKLIYNLMASEKLENQLTQKTTIETGEPNITAFLRSSLYFDLRLRNWWKEPGRFMQDVQGDKYFQEVMLSKAADTYRLGAFSNAVGTELENEIVETYARLYAPSKDEIQQIRNKKRTSIRRSKHLRTIRANLPDHGDE